METFFFQFEFLELASSAEIALLLENGDGLPVRYQLLNRSGLAVSNAELRRLKTKGRVLNNLKRVQIMAG